MINMNKDELIWELANRCGYTFKDSELFFNTLVEIFRDAIKNRVKLAVRGFGQLRYKTTAAHEGNKPTKGKKGEKERIMIPAVESVAFKLSTDLREIVKAGHEEEF